MKDTIFIEFDNSKLQNLSEKLYNLFTKNNYNTTILNNATSINDKNNIINQKSIVISNKINNDNSNEIEIIYPLRNTDSLAKVLSNKLSSIVPVTKYYQLRSSSNTILDYYEILRNISNEAIIIKYGNNIINNDNIPKIIFQAINDYLNNSNFYIVKSGDSLYRISKNFNTTVDELKRINNLTSNNLSIGQKLIIPSNNADNSSNNQNTYVVKSGDSLYRISKTFNTTIDEIKRINNLTSNILSIGQILIIPNNQITYTVVKGDSLYKISKNFNTTVDEIKRINNLTTNTLSIGQKLIIP